MNFALGPEIFDKEGYVLELGARVLEVIGATRNDPISRYCRLYRRMTNGLVIDNPPIGPDEMWLIRSNGGYPRSLGEMDVALRNPPLNILLVGVRLGYLREDFRVESAPGECTVG